MTFSQPSAGGDQFDAKDHNGRLLIVYPKSFSAETPTAHGISPSADVDIVIVDAVDATGKPLYFQNARLFGNLAKSVSRDLGGKVLGRLGQVPTQRGNPAWVLQSYTDQDAMMAAPADAAYAAGQFKQPENPMQQPAPAAAPAATPQYQTPAPAAPAQQQAWPAQGQPQQWNASGATPAPAQTPTPAAQQQAWPAQGQPQQWQQPAAPAPTPAPQSAPAAPPAPPQQWQTPPAAAPSAPAPAASGPAADPGLVAHLASQGINLPPGTSQTEALAIYETLPK